MLDASARPYIYEKMYLAPLLLSIIFGNVWDTLDAQEIFTKRIKYKIFQNENHFQKVPLILTQLNIDYFVRWSKSLSDLD